MGSYFGREPALFPVVIDQKLEPTAIVERTFVRDRVDQNEHVGPAHVHFRIARFLMRKIILQEWTGGRRFNRKTDTRFSGGSYELQVRGGVEYLEIHGFRVHGCPVHVHFFLVGVVVADEPFGHEPHRKR